MWPKGKMSANIITECTAVHGLKPNQNQTQLSVFHSGDRLEQIKPSQCLMQAYSTKPKGEPVRYLMFVISIVGQALYNIVMLYIMRVTRGSQLVT